MTAQLKTYQVRLSRTVTKLVTIHASSVANAESIGRSLAERQDWSDFDTLSHSADVENQ